MNWPGVSSEVVPVILFRMRVLSIAATAKHKEAMPKRRVKTR